MTEKGRKVTEEAGNRDRRRVTEIDRRRRVTERLRKVTEIDRRRRVTERGRKVTDMFSAEVKTKAKEGSDSVERK